MTDQDMFNALGDVVDADATSLTRETKLEDLNWDSMAMLTVIAMARTNGKKVTVEEVRALQTIGDVMKAVW